MDAAFATGGAVLASIIGWALGRWAQNRDRRNDRLDRIERSVGALRGDLARQANDVRDDLQDAMRQLARHVEGFTYRPRDHWRS